MISRPTESEYAPYYHTYVTQVPEQSVLLTLDDQVLHQALGTIEEANWDYRYQPDKWSIKEVLLHICDTERIFAYRALRISRGDNTPLPGFEQDDYIPNCYAGERSISSLLDELQTVRAGTMSLFSNLNAQQVDSRGIASGQEVTVRALAYLIAGHELHHLRIIKERYL